MIKAHVIPFLVYQRKKKRLEAISKMHFIHQSSLADSPARDLWRIKLPQDYLKFFVGHALVNNYIFMPIVNYSP
jgi:hypothetical protein